jgi:teichuronic acid biosynthesis glycosyltransferase TuaC
VHVLHVTNMYPTAARPVFGIIVKRLVDAQAAAGLDVRVEPIAGERGQVDYFRARSRVAAAARDFRPDVVHVHFGYSILATSGALPRVVSFYGDDLNGASDGRGGITLKSRLGRVVSWYAAHVCERSIALSPAMRELIPSAADRARCAIFRDAMDTRLFSPGDRAAARQRLGVSAAERRVLFINSLGQPTKRLDLANAAVSALREQGTEVQLEVLDGIHPDEMPDQYRASDVLLVTSDREGGPSCVKEALACGLPVVSVPVGDVDILRSHPAVCFIAERDPTAIARALEKALALRDVPRVNWLPSELTLANTVSRMRDLYADAIQRQGAIRRRPEKPLAESRRASV